MENTVDKRKVMTPERKAHMQKMREALAKKKELEKTNGKSEPKKKTKKQPEPVEQEVEIEQEQEVDQEPEEDEQEDEEVEEVVVKRKATPKKLPVKVKQSRSSKDDEIYELGKRVYKENKKKQLFDEVKQWVLQEFQIGGQEEYEEEAYEAPQQQSKQPANNLLSIF